MFRFLNSIRFYHRLLLLLLPVFCIGLFPIIFFRVNLRTMCAAERERAITQLRSVIESTGGKPSDEQLLNFERSYPKTKVAALARFLREQPSETADRVCLDSREHTGPMPDTPFIAHPRQRTACLGPERPLAAAGGK